MTPAVETPIRPSSEEKAITDELAPADGDIVIERKRGLDTGLSCSSADVVPMFSQPMPAADFVAELGS
jgi:hypothetical protein